MVALRRVFWLAVLAGAGFAGWTTWQRRQEADGSDDDSAPEWPPIAVPGTTADVATAVPTARPAAASGVAGAPADTTNGTGAPTSPDVAGFASIDDGGAADGQVWVEPSDGQCPISHPIKANDNSGIYHSPGGRFYDRTGAERCYASGSDAEADGYRAAKS